MTDRDDPVRITIDGGTATAALSGDFDMQATFTIEPALERALEEPDVRALVIDLSGLRFIDSTGLGVLIRIEGEAKRREIALSIVPGPADVHRVFEMAGLEDALPFTEP
jgi:anti-anti-sigma factor